MYSRLHPKKGLYRIMEHFLENAKLSENYFIADCEEMLLLQLLMNCPYHCMINTFSLSVLLTCAMKFLLRALHSLPKTMHRKASFALKKYLHRGTLQVPKTESALKELESIHKVLDLYVWLSFRLEDSFPDRELAASQKAICGLLIEEFLERFGWQKQPKRRKLPSRVNSGFLLSKETRQCVK
uniref:ATP-dependent RNA helicase SUV3 C-terminal domain-containing protein n=1 Tax=Salix viminalis TaxID=40686 RepID=A0A6N2MV41_SALVM